MVLLPDGSDCRGTNSLVVPFMLELVLASGQPVVNFASVTMSWVFFLHLLLVPLTFGQLYLCGLSLFRLVV